MRQAGVAVSWMAWAMLSAGVLRAQAAPEPVDFRPFADGRNWIVKQPLVYRVGISQDSVVVPRGFVTDFASIPPALQSLIQQNGPYLLPAVVHDFLYWEQRCNREESDHLLLLAMIENKVDKAHRNAIYNAVRAAGEFAWADNAKERKAGLVRVLPEDRIQIHALTLWADYRKALADSGVTDAPTPAISKRFCARGDMPTDAALKTP